MSHGRHTCHGPNGCHCPELREYEAAKAALGPKIAELMAEAQKVGAEIGEIEKERERLYRRIVAEKQAFAAKAKRLDTLIKEKPAESDAFLLASVKILKILKA
jgi:predicted  nucleic acid-binding Zn-ribbon protein